MTESTRNYRRHKVKKTFYHRKPSHKTASNQDFRKILRTTMSRTLDRAEEKETPLTTEHDVYRDIDKIMFDAHLYGQELARAEARAEAKPSKCRLENCFKTAEDQLKAQLDSLRRLSDVPESRPTAEEKLERARRAVAEAQNKRDATPKKKVLVRGQRHGRRSSISVGTSREEMIESIIESTKSGQRPKNLESINVYQLMLGSNSRPRGRRRDEKARKNDPMVVNKAAGGAATASISVTHDPTSLERMCTSSSEGPVVAMPTLNLHRNGRPDRDSSSSSPLHTMKSGSVDTMSPGSDRYSADDIGPRTGMFIKARRKSIQEKKAKALLTRRKRSARPS